MKKSYIKKFAMILTVLMALTIFGSFVFGTDSSANDTLPDEKPIVEVGEPVAGESQNTEDKSEDANLNDASETILENVTESERKKAYYIDKYNDEFFGTIAYALDWLRIYSLPVIFIIMIIGSFNFLIVGNKKLDKKEQGYSMIVFSVIALVVFNVLPLLYAVLVAGK